MAADHHGEDHVRIAPDEIGEFDASPHAVERGHQHQPDHDDGVVPDGVLQRFHVFRGEYAHQQVGEGEDDQAHGHAPHEPVARREGRRVLRERELGKPLRDFFHDRWDSAEIDRDDEDRHVEEHAEDKALEHVGPHGRPHAAGGGVDQRNDQDAGRRDFEGDRLLGEHVDGQPHAGDAGGQVGQHVDEVHDEEQAAEVGAVQPAGEEFRRRHGLQFPGGDPGGVPDDVVGHGNDQGRHGRRIAEDPVAVMVGQARNAHDQEGRDVRAEQGHEHDERFGEAAPEEVVFGRRL